ncbi:MAG: zinc permease [Pseudorhodoplanes sp.]|nr:MAG: zinc permease [Pseudorhodoplanes sp.]
MSAEFAAILLLSLLSVVTTALGVMLALVIRGNARAVAAGIGFSTGIMVLISAVELVPEAHGSLGTAGTAAAVALGAACLWLANLLIPHAHLVREHGQADTRLVKSVYLIVFGLILHDVPEGFAMANAYLASPSLGLLVGLAIALHNLPEEFAMALPAMTLRSRRFLVTAACLSALAEPLGAVIGIVAVALQPALGACFMAFAAGAMLFVSMHELVPMARRYRRPGWFVAGVAASLIVYRTLALLITT